MTVSPLISLLLAGSLALFVALLLAWKVQGPAAPLRHSMALAARSVLVTGASRGLGLEYVRQLVKLPTPPQLVIAACRDPHGSSQLQALATQHPTIKVIKLDVEKDEDIQRAFKEVKALVGDKGLNLLINNAGIYDQQDEGKLLNQTRSRLQKHFDINVSAPILVTQTFLPLLQQAAALSPGSGLSFSRSGVVMMTSYMGSQQITYENGAGTALHYKTSKSALTMAAVVLFRELQDSGVLVTALHPGWVRTDMGGSEAMFSVEDSIQGCLRVIGAAGQELGGKLVTFEGNVLPY